MEIVKNMKTTLFCFKNRKEVLDEALYLWKNNNKEKLKDLVQQFSLWKNEIEYTINLYEQLRQALNIKKKGGENL